MDTLKLRSIYDEISEQDSSFRKILSIVFTYLMFFLVPASMYYFLTNPNINIISLASNSNNTAISNASTIFWFILFIGFILFIVWITLIVLYIKLRLRVKDKLHHQI